jgi:predicted nucleotidyltransferase
LANYPVSIQLPKVALTQFCQRHHIRKLSVFGSVLRDDFRPDSDVDFLVEFEPEHAPGLIRLAGMELELSSLIQRKADLRTPQDLSRYFRDDVLQSAVVQYEQAG